MRLINFSTTYVPLLLFQKDIDHMTIINNIRTKSKLRLNY